MAGRGAVRRLAGTTGLLALGVGLIGLALFLKTQGLAKSTEWLSVIGGLFAVATVARGPAQKMMGWLWRRAAPSPLDVSGTADKLAQALAIQWNQEEERHRDSYPHSLPVRWSVTPQAQYAMAGVDWSDLGTTGRVVRPQLLAGEYHTIQETFTKLLPRQRLVVLGRGGSGKTSLARRLARELLRARTAQAPVPMVLSLASWDPETDLYTWVSQRLSHDYPTLEGPAAGPLGGALVQLSTALVQSNHLPLVLDGFDEIPSASRKAALEGIARLGEEVPVVVTSRTDEYRQAVQDLGRGLPRAAVVELSSVDARAIRDYLARTTAVLPPGRWDAVFALLDRVGSTVAQALQTPLMIWLARIVYKDQVANPAELAAFSDSTAIEHHLLDSLVQAAYLQSECGAEQAQRWLSFLARWLEHQGTSDLAWWQLPAAAPETASRLAAGLPVGLAAGIPTAIIVGTIAGPWTALACGAALTALATARAFSSAVVPFGLRLPGPIIGRVVALAVGLGVGLPTALRGQLALGVARGACAGILAGLAAGFIVHQGRLFPTRAVHVHGNVTRFIGRILVGLLIGLAFGTVLGVVLGLMDGATTGLVFAILSLAMGLALGIVDGLNVWIDTPTDTTRAISPGTVLRDDRTAAVLRALVAGPVVAAGTGLATAFAYGPATGIGLGFAMAFAFITTDRMVGMTSTRWGSFTLVGTWLALRRELPWHLMAFLDDAYQRGVLRQSGALYQFRHVRLQQRLAVDHPHAQH
jgi:NACHT domain